MSITSKHLSVIFGTGVPTTASAIEAMSVAQSENQFKFLYDAANDRMYHTTSAAVHKVVKMSDLPTVDTQAGNRITDNNGAWYVSPDYVRSVAQTQSATPSVSNGELTVSVRKSASTRNALVENADGLYVRDLEIHPDSASFAELDSENRLIVKPSLKHDFYTAPNLPIPSQSIEDALQAASEDGRVLEAGDIIFVPYIGKTYVHKGTQAGGAADWHEIEVPDLTEAAIRGMLSADAPIVYNASTGKYSLDLNKTANATGGNVLDVVGDKLVANPQFGTTTVATSFSGDVSDSIKQWIQNLYDSKLGEISLETDDTLNVSFSPNGDVSQSAKILGEAKVKTRVDNGDIRIGLDSTGATAGQVLKFDGTSVAWSDEQQASELLLATSTTSGSSFNPLATNGTLYILGNGGVLKTTDNENDAITIDFDTTSAAAGQVLKFNGASVAWANEQTITPVLFAGDNGASFDPLLENGALQVVGNGSTLTVQSNGTDTLSVDFKTDTATAGQVLKFNGTSVSWANDESSVEVENGLMLYNGKYGLGNKLDRDTTISMQSYNFEMYGTSGGKFGFGTFAGTATMTVGGDVEVEGAGKGVILTSANATKFRLTVDNYGSVVATSI